MPHRYPRKTFTLHVRGHVIKTRHPTAVVAATKVRGSDIYRTRTKQDEYAARQKCALPPHQSVSLPLDTLTPRADVSLQQGTDNTIPNSSKYRSAAVVPLSRPPWSRKKYHPHTMRQYNRHHPTLPPPFSTEPASTQNIAWTSRATNSPERPRGPGAERWRPATQTR